MPSPIIVGHRGVPNKFPENSLAGFRYAATNNLPAIELDVQFSKDHVPVVFHDEVLDRVTNNSGSIADYNFLELANISAHEPNRFADQFFPSPIFSLRQFCEALNGYTGEVFIEIKAERLEFIGYRAAVENVIKATRVANFAIVFISFDEACVAEFKRRGLRVGWVLSRYDENARKIVMHEQFDFVICDKTKIKNPSRLWITAAEWFIYDITECEEARQWQQAGVRYIESWTPITLNATVS